jgi:hypothetical protein
MSTLVAAVRKSVSGPLLVSALATAVAVGALVITLTGSSHAGSKDNNPTPQGTFSCQGTNQVELIATGTSYPGSAQQPCWYATPVDL